MFQGQLTSDLGEIENTEELPSEPEPEVEGPDPDLVPDMEIIVPQDPLNDIEVNATIRNLGEGALIGETPFVYGIYMNGALVFSNTDSYTTMEPGDEFSFTYPISRAIHSDDSGTITFKVDTENAISESDEGNNEVAKEFSF